MGEQLKELEGQQYGDGYLLQLNRCLHLVPQLPANEPSPMIQEGLYQDYG